MHSYMSTDNNRKRRAKYQRCQGQKRRKDPFLSKLGACSTSGKRKENLMIYFFFTSIKNLQTKLHSTLLTENLTTLRGRCHWVQNSMTTPWHHKKRRRLTYELRKENYKTWEKEAKRTTLCLKLDIRWKMPAKNNRQDVCWIYE